MESQWTDVLPLVSLLVKGAVLAAVALIVAALFKHRTAAMRHMVCALCLTGMLLLPLFSLFSLGLPIWNVPIRASAIDSPTVNTPAQKVAEKTTPSAAVPATAAIAPAEVTPPETSAVTVTTEPVNRWPFLLLAVYAAMVLGAVGTMLRDYAAARHLRHAAWSAEDGLRQTIAEAARELGVRRPVAVRYGNNVSVPMTMGLFRPTVLLPCDAAQWDTERLRVAVLHEVAHIRRGDFAWQMVARLACALHWCNPLAWLLARQMREEAERACDDCVLSAGVAASDYAGHLVAVARSLAGQRPVPSLAVSMARQGDLGRRIAALLAARIDRRGLNLWHGLTLATAITLVLLPLAALRSRLMPQPERMSETVAVATPAEKTTIASAQPVHTPGVFRHTLKDGSLVELIAVTRYPLKGKQTRWWKPDGTPGTGPLPFRQIGYMSGGDGNAKERDWAFIVRVTGPGGSDERGKYWKSVTSHTSGGITTGESLPDGNYSPAKSLVYITLPRENTTATFRFGVAPAKWEAASVRLDINGAGTGGGGFTANGHHLKYVSYGKAVVTQLDPYGAGNKPESGTFRHVTYSNIPDEDIRWVAETVDGKTVQARNVSGVMGTDDLMTTDLFFSGLRPKQIKEMRLETRAYEWVEFANVPLAEAHLP